MLRDIERGVLNDIEIGAGPAVTLGVATGGLVLGAIIVGWSEVTAAVGPVDAAAGAVIACHVLVSMIALLRRDFRWCCAATLSGGLSACMTVVTYWLHGSVSSTPGTVSATPGVAVPATAVFAAASTLAWLTVAARPLEASHPDILRRAHDGLRSRPHTDEGTHR